MYIYTYIKYFLFLIFIKFLFEESILSLMARKLKLIQVAILRGPLTGMPMNLFHEFFSTFFPIMRQRATAPLHQEISLKIWFLYKVRHTFLVGEKEVCDDFLDYLKTAAEPETSGIGTFSSSRKYFPSFLFYWV